MKLISGSLFFATLMLMSGLVQADQPFGLGETVTYSIKKFGVKIGIATLVYQGPVKIDDRDTLLIVFTADALNFYDREEIYCDPQNFSPVMVKRDLNIWGKKEMIEERYQTDQGRVVITKRAGGKTFVTEIQKEGILDNIYGFLYRFRNTEQPVLHQVMHLHLPTADVFLEILKETKIRAAGRLFDAFYLQSRSKQYRLWFGQDKHRMPIRIDGAMGLGSAVLMMTKYQPSTQP